MGYLEACDVLINNPDSFRMDIEKANALRFETIRGSFEHHYANNAYYRDFCKAMHVKPDDIKTFDDLPKIALLTSEFFKQISAYSEKDLQRIISVPPEKIVTYFTTSGTTGKPSKYPFDRESLIRLNKSNAQILKCIGEVGDEDKYVFLTPDLKHTPTGLVHGMYQSIETLIGKERAKEKVLFAIKTDESGERSYQIGAFLRFVAEGGVTHLFGPPFAYKDVAQMMKDNKLKVKMGEQSKAFTSGGWKGRQDEMITPRQLEDMITEVFGIDECNRRDGLGLTDVFSWMLECKYKKKHVPPWMHASSRLESDKLEDLSIIMPKGQEGIFAFLTSIISSYPAFITTGDLGALSTNFNENCECGRIGPTVEYRKRSGEPRGCALQELENTQKRIFDMGGGTVGGAKPANDPATNVPEDQKTVVDNHYEGHAAA